MSALLLLVACLALGAMVARTGKAPPALAQHLNWWVLNIAFSALVLDLIPTLRFDADLWFAVAAMYFVFLGSWGFFVLVGRTLRWPRARIGAMALVGGLGNTSFVGFPMIEALRGQEGLKFALIADQAGGFIALAVGGTILSALYSGGAVQRSVILRKVFLFPPFVCLFVGIAVGALGGWPDYIEPILARVGATLVPIALFSVGLQFRLDLHKSQFAALGLGLGWKLVLAPAIVYLAGRALGVEGLVFVIAVLQSAMAPMVSAAILAAQNDLEPELANSVLGIGILISLVTVPLIDSVL
jgi:predicted permease